MDGRMLNQDTLKEIISYDPVTGNFIWIKPVANRIKAGDFAGTESGNGYISIKIKSKAYLAHRLAWLYMTGKWPKCQIDHDNHIRQDNRWINLFEATNIENSRNRSLSKKNTSGFNGVSWMKGSKRWRAQIRVDGRLIILGLFSDINLAVLARKEADIKYGFSTNHGS